MALRERAHGRRQRLTVPHLFDQTTERSRGAETTQKSVAYRAVSRRRGSRIADAPKISGGLRQGRIVGSARH